MTYPLSLQCVEDQVCAPTKCLSCNSIKSAFSDSTGRRGVDEGLEFLSNNGGHLLLLFFSFFVRCLLCMLSLLVGHDRAVQPASLKYMYSKSETHTYDFKLLPEINRSLTLEWSGQSI